MNLASLVELSDVPGTPRVRITLPGPLRMGDRIRLHFRLRRTNGGRVETLDATGDWRVTAATLDATGTVRRQIVSVESTSITPTWRAIKKEAPWTRSVGPARFPRTTVV